MQLYKQATGLSDLERTCAVINLRMYKIFLNKQGKTAQAVDVDSVIQTFSGKS
jgi:hypothetical protein